jgi:hypothetical protein
LLAWGVAHEYLIPLAPTIPDWHTKGEARAFEDAYYGRLGQADRTPYALTKRGLTRRRRGDAPREFNHTLVDLAPELAKDLDAYLASCLDPFDDQTPQFIKKVKITAQNIRSHMDQLAGYAAYEYGLPAELLTLQDLCDPTLLRQFVPWFLKRRGRSTGGLRTFLTITRTIA